MSSPSPSAYSVVVDASFVIGLCAKEPTKYVTAHTELQQRIASGCTIHAPHLLVMEVSFVLCGKLQNGVLTAADYTLAVANFQSLLALIAFDPDGDANLFNRAEQIRQGYGCSHSADSFYLALTESLAIISLTGDAELLTFDAGQQKQATAAGLSVTVTLL